MKNSFYLLLIIFSINVNAQEKKADSSSHRYVALGIRSSIFQISELQQTILPPNRLLINIDPIKYIRVEGQFGIYSNTKQQSVSFSPGPPTTLKLNQKSSVTGIGLFGVYPVDKVKFSLGVRYINNPYSEDNIQTNPLGQPTVVTDKGTINTIAGVIGAEYLFSKWFSLGAEFGLLQMDYVFTPADYPTHPKLTTTNTITETCLIFRFYPY